MTIYFDDNKMVYGMLFEGVSVVASVDDDTWSIYSRDAAGTTWDIINGNFVQLRSMNDMKTDRMAEERSDERRKLLDAADIMLSKARDYIGTTYDASGTYANIANAIRQYKIDVRSTIHQINYPLSVVYPQAPGPVPTP